MPDRTDHYLMQISSDIRNSHSTKKVYQLEEGKILWSLGRASDKSEPVAEPNIQYEREGKVVEPPGPLTREKIEQAQAKMMEAHMMHNLQRPKRN